jgi:hypothetical protein
MPGQNTGSLSPSSNEIQATSLAAADPLADQGRLEARRGRDGSELATQAQPFIQLLDQPRSLHQTRTRRWEV